MYFINAVQFILSIRFVQSDAASKLFDPKIGREIKFTVGSDLSAKLNMYFDMAESKLTNSPPSKEDWQKAHYKKIKKDSELPY